VPSGSKTTVVLNSFSLPFSPIEPPWTWMRWLRATLRRNS